MCIRYGDGKKLEVIKHLLWEVTLCGSWYSYFHRSSIYINLAKIQIRFVWDDCQRADITMSNNESSHQLRITYWEQRASSTTIERRPNASNFIVSSSIFTEILLYLPEPSPNETIGIANWRIKGNNHFSNRVASQSLKCFNLHVSNNNTMPRIARDLYQIDPIAFRTICVAKNSQ